MNTLDELTRLVINIYFLVISIQWILILIVSLMSFDINRIWLSVTSTERAI